ncbi:MAG: ABC transporter substrate-binding protein [Chloroflexi bacterium]|nr:ABC transporter substrate-binding protein [Chloroflexota bacterium]
MRIVLAFATLLAFMVSCTTTSAPSPSSQSEEKAKAPDVRAVAKKDVKLNKLRVAYTAQSGSHTPLFIAKDEGLFNKNGLDVELVFVSGTPTAVQALVAGELDSVTVGSDVPVNLAINGVQTVLLTAASNSMVFYMYSKPTITKPQDLKGGTVGVSKFGSGTDMAAQVALRKFGLEPKKDYTLLQTGGLPETVAAIQAGGIDAGVISPPNSLKARKLGLKELIDITSLEIPFIMNAFAVKKDWLAKNEDVARRFVKSYVEGIALARNNEKVAKKIIGIYTKTEDQEIIDDTYNEWVTKVIQPAPYPNASSLQDAIDEIARSDARAKSYKAEQFIDARFIKELEDSGFIKSLYEKK